MAALRLVRSPSPSARRSALRRHRPRLATPSLAGTATQVSPQPIPSRPCRLRTLRCMPSGQPTATPSRSTAMAALRLPRSPSPSARRSALRQHRPRLAIPSAAGTVMQVSPQPTPSQPCRLRTSPCMPSGQPTATPSPSTAMAARRLVRSPSPLARWSALRQHRPRLATPSAAGTATQVSPQPTPSQPCRLQTSHCMPSGR